MRNGSASMWLTFLILCLNIVFLYVGDPSSGKAIYLLIKIQKSYSLS